MEFGEAVKLRRENLGMSQSDLSAASGTSAPNRVHGPGREKGERLAKSVGDSGASGSSLPVQR